MFKIYEDKKHPERVSHYNKPKDNTIIWDHMEYPAGNAGIAGCEELDKGLVSINIFKVFSTRYVVNERRTKN